MCHRFYPFHYAPFASDLVNIDRYSIEFELSAPFSPIEQLMAVLPSESAAALPEPCRELMLSPTSEIADFYPRDVPVDPNGKAMPWLWVLLLPFIDESRLVETIAPVFEKLTPEEGKRNALSSARIFVHASHSLAAKLQVGNLIARAWSDAFFDLTPPRYPSVPDASFCRPPPKEVRHCPRVRCKASVAPWWG